MGPTESHFPIGWTWESAAPVFFSTRSLPWIPMEQIRASKPRTGGRTTIGLQIPWISMECQCVQAQDWGIFVQTDIVRAVIISFQSYIHTALGTKSMHLAEMGRVPQNAINIYIYIYIYVYIFKYWFVFIYKYILKIGCSAELSYLFVYLKN